MQMGLEPSEMLLTSTGNCDAAGAGAATAGFQPTLQESVAAGADQPGHYEQSAGPTGNRGKWPIPGTRSGLVAGNGQMDEMAATWGQFVNNIEQHDERLNQERLSSAGQQISGTMIRDIYRPTAQVNGQRVGDGRRIVRQLQHAASQPASTPRSSQPAGAAVHIPHAEYAKFGPGRMHKPSSNDASRRGPLQSPHPEDLLTKPAPSRPATSNQVDTRKTSTEHSSRSKVTGSAAKSAPGELRRQLEPRPGQQMPSDVSVQPSVATPSISGADAATRPGTAPATESHSLTEDKDDWLIEL
ncbi:hypothetical protein VTK56DRAFT_9417 [Thermocarpiscus australiensis]